MSGVCLTQAMRDGGIPDGVFNMVMGPGETVGAELQENDGVDGILFTGSFEVGFDLYKHFAKRFPKPVIVEMGGKNPAIVSKPRRPRRGGRGRDARRVRLQRPEVLGQQPRVRGASRSTTSSWSCWRDKAERASPVGDPVDRKNWMGPVINQRALSTATTKRSLRRGTTDASSAGGERLTDDGLESGYFVAPTVVADLPTDHRLFRDELFLPFVVVAPVDSIDEALDLANDQRPRPDRRHLLRRRGRASTSSSTRIEAGVVYVNRRAGATTGAWPGVQPFGGWKGSTATGKAGGGLYYVQQFMREQSQTVVD